MKEYELISAFKRTNNPLFLQGFKLGIYNWKRPQIKEFFAKALPDSSVLEEFEGLTLLNWEFDWSTNYEEDVYQCPECGAKEFNTYGSPYRRCENCGEPVKMELTTETVFSHLNMEDFDNFVDDIAHEFGNNFDGLCAVGENMGWRRLSGYKSDLQSVREAIEACLPNSDYCIHDLYCGKGKLYFTISHHDGRDSFTVTPYWISGMGTQYPDTSPESGQVIWNKEEAAKTAEEIRQAAKYVKELEIEIDGEVGWNQIELASAYNITEFLEEVNFAIRQMYDDPLVLCTDPISLEQEMETLKEWMEQ